MSGCTALSSTEDSFRRLISEMDIDNPDCAALGVFGDWLEENGMNPEGPRRLAGCIESGSLLSACRITPPWQVGISPLRMAEIVASSAGAPIAEGNEVRFVCGPKVAEAVLQSPDVEKADQYPALHVARLPESYQTLTVQRSLFSRAFNTARLLGAPLYVYQDIPTLISTLERIRPPLRG